MGNSIFSRISLFKVILILVAGLATTGFVIQTNRTGNNGHTTETKDFRWSGHIAQDDYIEIHNINGDVRVVQASGNKVLVTAQKYSNGDDPESVHIEVVRNDDGVTICTMYPENSWWGGDQKCASGDQVHLVTNDSDVEVDYMVHIPAGVYAIVQTVNGDIDIKSIASNVKAVTVNGDINVSTKGYAQATTVNGSIEVKFGRTDWAKTLALATVNGDITVKLPASSNTEVDAETVSGDIETEFKTLDAEEGWVGAELDGTIGSGGRSLSLETVNGDVYISKK